MEENDSFVIKSVIGAMALVSLIIAVGLGFILGFVLNSAELGVILGGAIGFGLAAAVFAFSIIVSRATIES